MRNSDATASQGDTLDTASETQKDKFFTVEHLQDDLKGRSIRGGVITLIAQLLKFMLQMGSTFVLARLLTPEDHGLVAMVTTITHFAILFKDMGLSMAIIQRPEITHEQVSSLFWINLFFSLLIMLLIALLAPAISWFYSEPRLTWITLALACTSVANGLAVQHQALLTRQMRFNVLAYVETGSMLIGVLAAVFSAWYGIGYWALIILPLVTAVSMAIGVWIALPWSPGRFQRGCGVKGILVFGGHIMGFNCMNYFARNADNLLIGRYWGAGPLGIYTKAYSLMMLPLNQINAPLSSVVIPALSRLKEKPEMYRNYYLRIVSLMTFIVVPGLVVLIIMSKEFILIFLGPQWVGASKIFMMLGISGLIQPLYSTQGWLHISLGRSDRMLRWGFVGSIAIVCAFLLGIHYGPNGVAFCYMLITYILIGPCLWYAGNPIGLKLTHIFANVWKPYVSAIVAGLICHLVMQNYLVMSTLEVRISVGSVLICILYLVVVCVLNKGFAPVFDLFTCLRYLRHDAKP